MHFLLHEIDIILIQKISFKTEIAKKNMSILCKSGQITHKFIKIQISFFNRQLNHIFEKAIHGSFLVYVSQS